MDMASDYMVQIRDLLAAQGGRYLPEEELARRLGCSQAEIQEALAALEQQGGQLDRLPGLGAALRDGPDQLTEQAVTACLRACGSSRPAPICFQEIDSTNAYLKRTPGLPHGTAVLADCQTAGRGRSGRSFQSPSGKGVYLSLLLRPALTPEGLMPVTAMTAVAVCDAVERACGTRPQIKWTNDLLLGGKKIAGILTEMTLHAGSVEALIIGVGINVRQVAADFTPEVAEMATSLSAALGKAVFRPRLAAEMLAALDRMGDALGGDLTAWVERYRKDCVTLGRPVRLLWREGDSREAVALDVDEQFGLQVRYRDGSTETIRSGEVSVRGLYGYVE